MSSSGPTRARLEDFDVNLKTGFLPSRPLPHLPLKYRSWEEALSSAPNLLSLGDDESEDALRRRPLGEAWRRQFLEAPVLDTYELEDNPELQKRAHLVLAWLLHFFVHSIPSTGERILVPKAIGIPLVRVSRMLGIAPVLTYGDTVLWNWELVDPEKPVSMENIRIQNLFTGRDSERNFYHASAQVEFFGIDVVRIIERYNRLSRKDVLYIPKAARCLNDLESVISGIAEVMGSIRSACDPHEFYWDVRPWFDGADSKGPSSAGWTFEGIPNSQSLDLSGPSAGQSSVIHAVDIFLDIDHKLRERRAPAPSRLNAQADRGFMDRMRRYMPGPHRAYLTYLEQVPHAIRSIAKSSPALREPYDSAVMALKQLRDSHIRIVCLYVINMSHQPPKGSGCPATAEIQRLRRSMEDREGPIRGTGGTDLAALLKAGRDATRRAVLKP